MKAINSWINQHPVAYIAICTAMGALLRFYMAGGDMARFMHPLWIPLIHQW